MKTTFSGMPHRARKKADNATRILVCFFGIVILLGTILLSLPVSSREGQSCGLLTALFTATSATCVTGLSVVDTWTQWSAFGQIVLLGLIQTGGLGYMTLVSIVYFALRRRIGLRERLVIQQAMALNELSGVVHLVKVVLVGTIVVEGIGAALLTARFSMLFPFKKALWMGIFHAISAYCNAGFDVLGFLEPGSSLTAFSTDVFVNLVIAGLVILGGLGFFVWNDLLMHQKTSRYSVYTKLVLTITAVLLIGGAALIALVEWNNPMTLGNLNTGDKLLASFFQSMTTRTAGFAAIGQGEMTGSGKLISICLMFVGGSGGSTAGGIKTVSVGLLFMMAVSVLRGRRDVTAFGRRIRQEQINSAAGIAILVLFLGVAGGVFLSASNGLPLGDCLYETASAICTVGLSTGITAEVNLASKILLIVYMFFGRVGIMTISFAFMMKRIPENGIRRPETWVLIG
ncbi:MAG: potassium transporter TrkG [Oscillospiraceae bacterium]|nr:potassium transporter TrkG [Oscillospiraceae bacterium]